MCWIALLKIYIIFDAEEPFGVWQCLFNLQENKAESLRRIQLIACWRRGNTFAASHRYGPDLTLGDMWDVFHPSQPKPDGFPLGVFFHPQKGSKLFHLEPSHKADGLARTCPGWRKINGFTFIAKSPVSNECDTVDLTINCVQNLKLKWQTQTQYQYLSKSTLFL